MIKRYIKKPIVIDACQWTGDNVKEIKAFTNDNCIFREQSILEINTLNGYALLDLGEYVLKGIQGEFYPCKEEIFYKTYEEII